jgi:hypothetical protein
MVGVSNWIKVDSSLTTGVIQSKYPIRMKYTIVNLHGSALNDGSIELNPDAFKKMPDADADGFKEFALAVLPVDKNGNPMKDGCYQTKMEIRSYADQLSAGDIPNTSKTPVFITKSFGWKNHPLGQ